jgi:hypothetical protein
MRRVCLTLLAAVLVPCVSFAQYMQIAGVVMTSRGVPLPGCIVQIFGDPGPSYPVSTGAQGEYFFPQVPNQVLHLYTIQVRWGDQLIYTGMISHPGQQEPIVINVP